MLDGVYRCGADGEPLFVQVPAPTDEALQAVLHRIITRTMKLLTRRGVLIEEQGPTYMADNDGDSDEARARRPLQAAACYLPHRAWTTRRPEGADGARCNAEGDGCRFPFNLSLLIFQLALLTLSMCHQAAGLADVTPARHRFLPPLGF